MSNGGSRKVLSVGDDISTDDIIPARRCTSADPEHLGRYALEHLLGEGGLRAEYREIEAGRNFGCGSSREHAPIALLAAGVEKVVAESFAPIFFRNSVNIGLPLQLRGASRSDATVKEIIKSGGLLPLLRDRAGKGVANSGGNDSVRPAGLKASSGGTKGETRAMTLTEKLLARAAKLDLVAAEETVFVQADLAMSHDAVAGPAAKRFYDAFGRGARVWDPSRIVLVADHFIQVPMVREDEASVHLYEAMISFARDQGCHVVDKISAFEAEGICHIVLPEKGFVKPNAVIAGTDSHTCTQGAFGCFAVGVGTTDMAGIFATGEFWLKVPPTIRVILRGDLAPQVAAKDLMLHLLENIGCDGASGAVLEFCGSGVRNLTMEDRMTMANMAVECGAVTGIFAADDLCRDWLRQRGAVWDADAPALESDAAADFAQTLELDLAGLRSSVARPGKPDRVAAVLDLERTPIHKAFIGSCTGGKLEDLKAAAVVLRGSQVAEGVRLFVVPASQEVLVEARRLGLIDIFESAGAEMLPSGCGACINAGPGTVAAGEVGVFATSRNFAGRSGDTRGDVWLASPRTVAISAVAGYISASIDVDPVS